MRCKSKHVRAGDRFVLKEFRSLDQVWVAINNGIGTGKDAEVFMRRESDGRENWWYPLYAMERL